MKKYIKANSDRIDWAKIAEDNYDKLVAEMEEVHLWDPQYQVDIYLYPDGEVSYFINPGGNSWLNDDHITVASINHEFWDHDNEDYTEDGEYNPNMDLLREDIYNAIDAFIERAERGDFDPDDDILDDYEW